MELSALHFLYWAAAYCIGALPFGWIIVKLVKKKDLRYMASGRMGMSNVMRNAGKFWGIVTAVLDIAKGFVAIRLAGLFISEPQPWMLTIGGILAVLGHIYSIFLIERRRDKRYYLRGGAGGLVSIGVSLALWNGMWLAIPLPCLVLYLFSGYASVATAAFNAFGMIGFIIGAALGKTSLWFVLYAAAAEILVLLSLRPNFKRLRRGDERKHSLRIRWRKEDRSK